MAAKKRVLLIDDHPLIRRGIKQLIELGTDFTVVGEASNGEEGIKQTEKLNPDLIILDLKMSGLSGLDTLKELRKNKVDARIAIFTVSDSKADIFALVEAGADGYLLKDSEPDVILEQIKKIADGEIVFSEAVQQTLLENKGSGNPLEDLTERETDVLQQIALGLSNKQIAEKLFISEETVKVHIRNVLGKLNVHSRVAAAVIYLDYHR